MKNRNKAFVLLLLVFMLVMVFPIADTTAYAATGTQVMSTDIDTNLFAKLAKVRGTNYLTTESFNSSKYESISLKGAGTVNTDSNIEDVTGLTKFKFEFTKKLDLSNNSIEFIDAETLSAFPKLEELIVSDNLLLDLDVTGCYNLKRVIVDNNQLTEFDATDMYATGAELDLSANMIGSVNDITLPSQMLDISMDIKLYNNNIQDFTSFGEGYTVNLGIQGLRASSEDGNIEQKQNIVYYKTNDAQQLKTVITSNGVEKYSFVHSEMTEDKLVVDLPNGNYEVNYYFVDVNNGNTLIESSTKRHPNPASEQHYAEHIYLRYYTYSEFSVIPTMPEFRYVIDGVEQGRNENVKITKKCTIKFNSDEGSKIYYQIGNSEWFEGGEYYLEQGGSYQIRVKAVSADGLYESRVKTIYVNAAVNLTLPGILMLVLVVMLTILIFGVGFPLLRKYVF